MNDLENLLNKDYKIPGSCTEVKTLVPTLVENHLGRLRKPVGQLTESLKGTAALLGEDHFVKDGRLYEYTKVFNVSVGKYLGAYKQTSPAETLRVFEGIAPTFRGQLEPVIEGLHAENKLMDKGIDSIKELINGRATYADICIAYQISARNTFDEAKADLDRLADEQVFLEEKLASSNHTTPGYAQTRKLFLAVERQKKVLEGVKKRALIRENDLRGFEEHAHGVVLQSEDQINMYQLLRQNVATSAEYMQNFLSEREIGLRGMPLLFGYANACEKAFSAALDPMACAEKFDYAVRMLAQTSPQFTPPTSGLVQMPD